MTWKHMRSESLKSEKIKSRKTEKCFGGEIHFFIAFQVYNFSFPQQHTLALS